MWPCPYHYCRRLNREEETSCGLCGHPRPGGATGESSPDPRLPVRGVVDMHQILPDEPHVLERQLEMMERFGIRRALLQAVPSAVKSIWGNSRLREVRDAHPDRFWISQFADPRLFLVRRKIRQIHEERRVRVVKVLPCLGFDPDSPRWDRFWAALDERCMTVMAHTGFITARHVEEERRAGVFLNSRHCHPLMFDRVARKFGRLQIILCHMGEMEWAGAAAMMVTQHANVWGDFSGFGLHALRSLLRSGAPMDWEKVFWGNDASPDLYPRHLTMLMNILEEANAVLDLGPKLLRDNADRFASNHLS